MQDLAIRTTTDFIATKIIFLRGEKVLLDADLALLYGVETKALKRAVRRNIKRFPPDFLFELSKVEWDNLKYQFGTSSGTEKDRANWGGTRYTPFAFTEQGVAMLSGVLNSPRAIETNTQITRATKGHSKIHEQLYSEQSVRWPGKKAGMRWHERGSLPALQLRQTGIFLPSVSRPADQPFGQVAYFFIPDYLTGKSGGHMQFKFNTTFNPEQVVRWPGKMARVCRHARGSIILPSVFAYFLGDAKSRSLSGLSASSLRDTNNMIRVHTTLDRQKTDTQEL